MNDETRAAPQGAIEPNGRRQTTESARTGSRSRVFGTLRDRVPETRAFARERHTARLVEPEPIPAPDATPELAAAWHSLQLYWLRELPGYRELIRERVSEAAKAAESRTRRIEQANGSRSTTPTSRRDDEDETRRRVASGLRELLDAASTDVDLLGREVEGCG